MSKVEMERELVFLTVILQLGLYSSIQACEICSCCKDRENACDSFGKCKNGCIDGFYGDKCTEQCPSNCVSCYSATGCHLCKNALFYGPYCQYKCSYGCVSCMCNKARGRCRRGCKTGFNGDYCDKCNPGLYGPYCNKTCEDGKYGMNCMSSCRDKDINCQSCVSDVSGQYKDCTKCNHGYRLLYQRGENMRSCHKCPYNCKDTACNDVGVCTNGCLRGKWGDSCNIDCKVNCVECRQKDGKCLIYSGLESNQVEGSSSDRSTQSGAILGVGFICIVCGVSVIVALIMWRKRISKNYQTGTRIEIVSTPREETSNGNPSQIVTPFPYETLGTRDERMYSHLTSSQTSSPVTYETLGSRNERMYSHLTSSQTASPITYETLGSRDERMYSQITSSQTASPITYETLASRDERVYSQITTGRKMVSHEVEYDYSAY